MAKIKKMLFHTYQTLIIDATPIFWFQVGHSKVIYILSKVNLLSRERLKTQLIFPNQVRILNQAMTITRKRKHKFLDITQKLIQL